MYLAFFITSKSYDIKISIFFKKPSTLPPTKLLSYLSILPFLCVSFIEHLHT